MKTEYTCQSSQQPISKKLSYDQQFHQIYTQIIHHQYFPQLSKHDKIRINKWLTKLSNISTNDLWKKNRNNYIKLIRLMLDCQVIIAPFLMMPPERDLHKLTTHQINVIIDQVDKLVEERQLKNSNNTITGGNHNNKSNTSKQRFNHVMWTQQAGYVNHLQNSSIQKLQKFKQSEQDCKRTFECSSVTTNTMSKLSQLTTPHHNIPPKYPSQSTSKSPLNQKPKNTPIHQQQQKQVYSIKQSCEQSCERSLSPQNYFRKKERLNTFETEEVGQDEYLLMMKNSSLQRGDSAVYEKDNYDIKHQSSDNFFQAQSRQAINILKCEFRLLEKLPQQAIQESSIKEIQTFRKLITENQFLKQDLQKETAFLELLSERNTSRTVLNEISSMNSINNTQKLKLNDKKKMKLSIVSQGQTMRNN